MHSCTSHRSDITFVVYLPNDIVYRRQIRVNRFDHNCILKHSILRVRIENAVSRGDVLSNKNKERYDRTFCGIEIE